MAAGFVVVAAATWLDPDWAAAMAQRDFVPQGGSFSTDLGARLVAGLLSCFNCAFLSAALWTARGLFLRIANGQAIATETGFDLRQIGAMVALYAMTTPVMKTLTTLALTIGNPPGQKILAVSLSSNELTFGLLGALILVLGHVMGEAARIADDNRQIV